MLIRNAVQKDLPQIMKIYENARSYMRKTGNPTQWSGGYPGEDVIRRIWTKEIFMSVKTRTVLLEYLLFLWGEIPII